MNYLWSRKEQRARTTGNGAICWKNMVHGVLGLVDQELAKSSILCKWIIYAMKPGELNFQVFTSNGLVTRSQLGLVYYLQTSKPS